MSTSIFSAYLRANLLVRILVAFVLGAIIGAVFGPSVAIVKPLGDVFIRLLKMVVMPLIFVTLVVGAASASPASLGRVGLKAMVFYLLTTGFAVVIGLVVAGLLRPGVDLTLGDPGAAAEKLKNIAAPPSLKGVFLNIIPTNPFAAFAGGKVLPTIFFALVSGVALSYVKSSKTERIAKLGDQLFTLFDGFSELLYCLVRGILQYAPIGVFCLIAVVFATQGGQIVSSLGMILLTCFSAYLLHVIFTYSLLLSIGKVSPLRFFKKGREAMLTAFVTRSSSGTLPVTMRCCQQMGVSRSIFSFTLPLGATINMDGTAMYMGIAAAFIGNVMGAPLSIMQQAIIVVTAVLASVGAAGVPGVGSVMLLMVLESVGLPMTQGTPIAAAYAMILGIDAILDMGRTAVNVTGDMVGTVVIAKSEGESLEA